MLAGVPKMLFELALRRIGTDYQSGRDHKSLPSLGFPGTVPTST